MKLIKILYCAVLVIIIASAACAKDKDIESLSVKSGSLFTITLRCNPTTGYSWKIAKISGASVIKEVSSVYLPDNTGLTGSGGRQIWKLKALKCGSASIEFAYQRPWEKDVPPVEKKKYLVKITMAQI